MTSSAGLPDQGLELRLSLSSDVSCSAVKHDGSPELVPDVTSFSSGPERLVNAEAKAEVYDLTGLPAQPQRLDSWQCQPAFNLRSVWHQPGSDALV